MDRKSCEMSPGETESSGSATSHSDDQEGLRASPNDSSPIDESLIHAQSPEISSNSAENKVQETVKSLTEKSPEISSNSSENEVQETVKSLTEKLSAALLSISAKEDLVKQHSKVAEEAVSGWEKAETEVAVLKQQLEATAQKNSALQDKISHLDGALKECVRQLRQLRQSKEEQEQKVHDAVVMKTQEWGTNKFDLENQLIELKKQFEASKAEADTILAVNLSKLDAIDKENAALKAKCLILSEELKIRTLERELSTQTAETASKQHLESIKKVAKLEAECRKLRAAAQRTLSINDHKTVSSSACVESLTDSQSDNGDRFIGVDNELSCSDSWASALIAELDQFKNKNAGAKALTSSVDIDLMDDFLEMERFAAMPEADNGSSSVSLEADSDRDVRRESLLKVGDEILKQKIAELEEKVEMLETVKAKLELAESQNQHEISCNQLTVAEGKLIQLQKELELANESKQTAMEEAVSVDAKRKVLQAQLESTLVKVAELQDKVVSLEGRVEESALSSQLKTKLEDSEAQREAVESQLQLAYTEVEKLRKKVGLLKGKIEEEKSRSAELAAKVDTAEATRKAMGLQFLSADLEVQTLQEKVSLLEQRIEDERLLSAEFAAKVEAAEGESKALVHELELARSEVQKLKAKVGFLKEEVDNERTFSTEFAARCQNLENELLRKRQEAELRVVSCSNADLTVQQEKELAVAAEKLTECQKTIASLGRQLKSLTTIDDFVLESEKVELNGNSPNYRSRSPSADMSSSTLPNGKEKGSPPSPTSSTSKLSGLGRLLSRSRSSSIENQ